jgi:hypothetical protein
MVYVIVLIEEHKKIPKIIQNGFDKFFNAVDKLVENQESAKAVIVAINEKINARPSLFEGARSAPAQDTPQIERLKSELTRLNNENSTYRSRINGLENEIKTLREEKSVASDIASGSLDPVSVFNNWAASPASPLPKAFCYIEGDMNIRTPRELKPSSNVDSKWISNYEGEKFLFPNPNSFNQMTNLSELYKMDQSKLKSKGQNRIKIVRPCKMTNSGFVEFPGELEIL